MPARTPGSLPVPLPFPFCVPTPLTKWITSLWFLLPAFFLHLFPLSLSHLSVPLWFLLSVLSYICLSIFFLEGYPWSNRLPTGLKHEDEHEAEVEGETANACSWIIHSFPFIHLAKKSLIILRGDDFYCTKKCCITVKNPSIWTINYAKSSHFPTPILPSKPSTCFKTFLSTDFYLISCSILEI